MQKIGIGYEDYREFIEKDLYYVDKTSLVKDIVEKGGKVTLFTRPRRFGKTLALSMLRTFFEEEYTPKRTCGQNRIFCRKASHERRRSHSLHDGDVSGHLTFPEISTTAQVSAGFSEFRISIQKLPIFAASPQKPSRTVNSHFSGERNENKHE